MNYALVNETTTIVENVVAFDSEPDFEWPDHEFVPDPDSKARIGGTWDGSKFVPPPAEPIIAPVPDSISDRQCFQQLAIGGLITQQEALTYLGNGTLPSAFEAFVEALPEEQQFDARMKLMANNFRRSDTWVGVFGQMQGMTPEQIDQLWRDAAIL